MTTEELIERLIAFAAMIILFTDSLKRNRAGLHLNDQMSRSSISTGLNYGEATGAESPRDFVHKMQIVLKELRETWIALRITGAAKLSSNPELLKKCLDENNQLISIFTKSITTNKEKLRNL
jgi:four helix bundle protein